MTDAPAAISSAEAAEAEDGVRAPSAARFSLLLGAAFGYAMLALSLLVTVEALARKLFSFSLQGVDELGGYALAVGSSLCFTVALIERAHIRIDLLLARMPVSVRATLDWLSIVLLAGFAVLLVWVCAAQLMDSIEYHSTAATPWQTPQVWPQSLWVGALAIFMAASVAMAAHATALFFSRRLGELERLYGAKAADEELLEELDDASSRS